jgi:hypothetical protein
VCGLGSVGDRSCVKKVVDPNSHGRCGSFRGFVGSVIADTIVRTVELGVTITDAAIDGETTVVWCGVVWCGATCSPRVLAGARAAARSGPTVTGSNGG